MKRAAIEIPAVRDHSAAPDEEPADRSLYDEYVRGFDDVPVLSDAVRIPPRRAGQPSFTRGERRDLRREARQDAYVLRETSLAALARLYAEYDAAQARAVSTTSAAKAKTKTKRKKRHKTKKR